MNSPAHTPRRAACAVALLVDVVVAVPPIGQGEPGAHQRGAQVRRADAAHGDDAAVGIHVALHASHVARADEAAQLGGGGVAAAPFAAVAHAGLAAFGCVDAEQAHGRRADLERVAVDEFGIGPAIRSCGVQALSALTRDERRDTEQDQSRQLRIVGETIRRWYRVLERPVVPMRRRST